jgi:hypothetical protein
MQIVQITNEDKHGCGLLCIVPAEVHVIPVDDIDEANKMLPKLVKGQLEKLDIDFAPIADGEHRGTDSNAVIEEESSDDDFYYLKTVKEASNTEPVAELSIEETPIQVTWFLVD